MSPLRPSIRTRLMLWYAATVAVVLGVYVASVSVGVGRSLSSALDRQVEEDHRVVEANIEHARDGAVRWRAPTGAIPRDDESDDRWVFVAAEDGHIVHRRFPKRFADDTSFVGSAPAHASGIVRVEGPDGGMIRAFVGRHSIGGRSYLVFAGRSEAHLRAQIRAFAMPLLLGLPLGVALAGLVGYLLARRTMRPVDAITEHATRITADRLTEEIPAGSPDDELGRLARAFNETFRRIARSFEQLRNFTADASHELRTPLTTLRAVGEVGMRDGLDAEARRDVIGSMLEEADRLSRLLDALLTLARAEGGGVVLDRVELDLAALACETARHMTILCEERAQSIVVTGERTALVRADAAILRQALLCLIDNAVKYSDDGSRIEVRIERREDATTLTVSDDGPGIPVEQRARVFDRFYRVAATRARDVGGFGLGLSIARWAVEAHDGTLTLDERVGRGSTFVIRLPAVVRHHAHA